MALLNLRINGLNDPRADFADVAEFCDALTECLRRVYRSRNPGFSALPRYRVQNAGIGSLTLDLAGDEVGEQVAAETVDTVSRIRHRERPSIQLTGDDVRAFRKLARPLESNTKSIEIGDVPIDARFVSGCDFLLSESPKSYGEMVGRLDGMNVHNRNSFRLYPEGETRGAECFFPDELYEKVHSLMRRRVRVAGLIQRDPDGVGVDSISQISSVDPLPEANELPSLQSLIGIFAKQPLSREFLDSGWE